MNKLYAMAKTGKIKQWQINVIEENGTVYITEEYGLVGKKLQLTKNAVTKGKNIGRKNETTPLEQANIIANAKYNKKIDKGYTTEPNPKPVKLPMLVKVYTDHKKKVKYPAYIQPKLNGVRGLVLDPNKVDFLSRGNKIYDTVDFLKEDIKKLGVPVDGEIFKYGLGFQDIIRLVKKEREGTEQLNYWIYDIPNPHKTFKERYTILEDLFSIHGSKENITLLNSETLPIYRINNIYLNPTYIINNEKELEEYHNQFNKQGFEGSIIRNFDGLYLFTFKSDQIFKYKDFNDDEFEIVDFTEGKNREKGCIMFVCKVNDASTVTVRPKGSLESRKEMFEHGSDYIGKMMTIKYKGKTEIGNLVMPVGLAVRDYE